MCAFNFWRRTLGLVATTTLALAWAASAPADTITYGPTFHDNGGIGYGNGASGTFLVPQFDDLGGSRTLTRVTLTVKIDSTGGSHEFDNESGSAAEITLGIGAQVRVKGPNPIVGSRLIVNPDATETVTGFVTADTDASPDFIGTDALGITGVMATDTRVGSKAAAIDLEPYIGVGNAAFEFDGGTSTTGTGPLPSPGANKVTFGTTNFSFTTTVQYEFVPEPATLVLFGTGAVGLLARAWARRRRAT